MIWHNLQKYFVNSLLLKNYHTFKFHALNSTRLPLLSQTCVAVLCTAVMGHLGVPGGVTWACCCHIVCSRLQESHPNRRRRSRIARLFIRNLSVRHVPDHPGDARRRRPNSVRFDWISLKQICKYLTRCDWKIYREETFVRRRHHYIECSSYKIHRGKLF